MATVTFTTRANLAAGNPENIADVTDCLDKLQTGINNVDASNITDGTITPTEITSSFADTIGVNTGTTRRGFSLAAAEVSTTSGTPVLLAGDSSVVVTQPTNGLTAVYLQAEIKNSVGAANNLFGFQVDGLTNYYAFTSIAPGTLYSGTAATSAPGDPSLGANSPYGGWFTFYLPGTHSYRLHYSSSGGSTAFFRNRLLAVKTDGF